MYIVKTYDPKTKAVTNEYPFHSYDLACMAMRANPGSVLHYSKAAVALFNKQHPNHYKDTTANSKIRDVVGLSGSVLRFPTADSRFAYQKNRHTQALERSRKRGSAKLHNQTREPAPC